MSATQAKKVARIFEDLTGWFYCDDASEMLDARGKRFGSKREAIAWLRSMAAGGQTEYTHYRRAGAKPKRLA